MNYSENSHDVQADFFKPSGKWYMTERISMEGMWNGDQIDLFNAVEKALDANRPGRPGWWKSYTVVVLEPYHQYGHPVMFLAEEVRQLWVEHVSQETETEK